MTGIEPADVLFKYVVAKEQDEPLGIQFFQQDLSKFNSKQKFDSVVSNMVFMDIPEYEKAISNCIASLKSQGAFIFSISHPCFEDGGDEWEKNKQVVIKEYFKEYAVLRNHGYSFHRSLSVYINFVIQSGCEIVQMIEPQLPENIAKENSKGQRDVHVPSFVIIYAIKK